MDETCTRLLRKLRDLEDERKAIETDIEAIERTLEIAGVKPTAQMISTDYAGHQRFENQRRLVDACVQVLRDADGEWLTKSQIEYCLIRGGFQFDAKDSKNSVDVTLRRLASENKIELEATRGKFGNKYRWDPRLMRPPVAKGPIASGGKT